MISLFLGILIQQTSLFWNIRFKLVNKFGEKILQNLFSLGPDAAPIAEDVDYPEATGPEFGRLEAASPEASGSEAASLEAANSEAASPESSGPEASSLDSIGLDGVRPNVGGKAEAARLEALEKVRPEVSKKSRPAASNFYLPPVQV